METKSRLRSIFLVILFCFLGTALTSGFSLWGSSTVKKISASGLIEADVYEVSAEPLVLSQSTRTSTQANSSSRQNRFQPVGMATEVLLSAGDKVKKGSILLRLDDTAARFQLEQARAKVTLLEASINMIDNNLEDVQDGISKVNDAIDKLESQIRQVKSARSQYESLMSQLAQAQADLARAQATGDPARIAQALAALQALTQALAQLQAGMGAMMGGAGGTPAGGAVDFNSIIAKMESGLRKAKSGRSDLYTAETNLMIQEAALPHQLQAARIGVEIAEAQVKKAEIKAPIDGWILKKNISQGETVFPSATLMIVADLKKMKLRLFIPLAQVKLVKIDQKAEVTIDSYPNKVFEGKVSRISSKVEFMPSNVLSEDLSATQVVEVILAIDNPDLILKPGMPADASIYVGRERKQSN